MVYQWNSLSALFASHSFRMERPTIRRSGVVAAVGFFDAGVMKRTFFQEFHERVFARLRLGGLRFGIDIGSDALKVISMFPERL